MTALTNTIVKDNIFSDYMKINNVLVSIISSIVKYIPETILIADNKFRIVFSNSSVLKKGENIYNKLKLKKKHLSVTSTDIKRSMVINKKICSFLIDIIKISADVESGYIIFFKKQLNENGNVGEKSLLSFLKHDLTTQIISQIRVLKLILNTENNDILLPDVLKSAENSYRMLKSHISEAEYEANEMSVSRKEVSIKLFFDEIKKYCENFLELNNNSLNFSTRRNSRAYIDSKMLKDALVNILYYINRICGKNSDINVMTDVSHDRFRIFISFPYGKLSKEIFSKENYEENQYYRRSNCLYISEKIIAAHSGKIKILNEKNISYIKIYMPK